MGVADDDSSGNLVPADSVPGPWRALRAWTPARIGLGRSGDSLPTARLLEFDLAYAQARDAVHRPLDRNLVRAQLSELGVAVIDVHSAAPLRQSYLLRPDLGRRLDDVSRERLMRLVAGGREGEGRDPERRKAEGRGAEGPGAAGWDAVFVVADGLSAWAAHRHAVPVLALARAALRARGWSIGPVVVAEQARVALGDEIGELLGARQVVMLIGERPGLSSPDSLGAYLTAAPRIGRRDAERNCVSNIRPEGLGYRQAAHTLAYLMIEARRLGLTGVSLKDDSAGVPLLVGTEAGPPSQM